MKLNKLGPFAPNWYTEVPPTIFPIYSPPPSTSYPTLATNTCTIHPIFLHGHSSAWTFFLDYLTLNMKVLCPSQTCETNQMM